MKHLAFLASLLLVAACSTGTQGSKANVAQPQIDIEQTFGPGDLGYPDAPIDVKYQIQILNKATVPITLKRINLHTVNPPGGAYTLSAPLVHPFNDEIPPGGEKTLQMWAHAQGYGVSMRDREPVTIKGVAYFETPQGYINVPVNQELQQ